MNRTSSLLTPITDHAVDRWCQRVDRRASRLEGRLAIQQILCLGRWRVRPRHWMTDAPFAPGVFFVFWASRAHVCVIVRDGVAVTVITRAVARASRAQRDAHPPQHVRVALDRVSDWRWDGVLDLEDAA